MTDSVGITWEITDEPPAGEHIAAAVDFGDPAPTLAASSAPPTRVPHIAWPLTLRDGRLATVEQDTLVEVKQCITVLLHTEVGTRVLTPDYGIDDPTFTDGLDVDELVAQAAEYEPRAAIEVLEVLAPDSTGQSTTRIEVDLA